MNAYAYVIGPRNGPGAALFEMAQAIGFAGVSSFRGLAQVEEQTLVTPICYFLFATVPEPASLRPLVEAVRFCPKGRVRFSPLVYFATDSSLDIIKACVNMGFDDIVALPHPLRSLRQRIERQVGQAMTYYETASYFGPDRRKGADRWRTEADKRTGAPFRRIEMVRSLSSGVDVLSDATHPSSPPVALMQTLQ
ncbi:MAG: hypothetical protein KIS86_08815 [Devosia sp.]|nr:hypothetical protein [Devosia sp.]